MNTKSFIQIIKSDFFTGVPDSQLRPLCDYLYDTYQTGNNHIIAANEGNCAAIAAGYHLATGKIPLVYLQNSGIGNLINPAASLLHPKVYGIPCIFVIGWRGEPGIKDEPQHIYQGEVTISLLEKMQFGVIVLEAETTEATLSEQLNHLRPLLSDGKSIAIVVKKDALSYEKKVIYQNQYKLSREEIIRQIISVSGDDLIVSTTGKTSRELWEIRNHQAGDHQRDFLTVGSMGHASSIALGIALQTPDRRVWCIDGDGAALMHLGAMAVIGQYAPKNLIHVVINNGAHESVGGMPTVARTIDLAQIASQCGYPYCASAKNQQELDLILQKVASQRELIFIETKTAIGSRKDLGRPSISPIQNKQNFMGFIQEGGI